MQLHFPNLRHSVYQNLVQKRVVSDPLYFNAIHDDLENVELQIPAGTATN